MNATDFVASHLSQRHSPDKLTVHFSLKLGQVYAALAHYYQQKVEIDALLQDEADKANIYLN